MASNTKNDKSTKYTFKGNNKKVENKYANIYQELNEKEVIYEANSLKKIHKLPEGEEPKQTVREPITRTISLEEAQQNAQRRKQAMVNEKQLATQRSTPVIAQRKKPELDRLESLERLKREKRESRIGSEDLFSSTRRIDLSDLSQDPDQTARFSRIEDEEYEDIKNDPSYIKQKAKERASMDKSDVEIYKEYSDFDRPKSDRVKTRGEKLADTLRHQRIRDDEDIRLRESEIEEIIRRRQEQSDSPTRGTRSKKYDDNNASFSQRLGTSSSKNNSRAEIYKRNYANREPKINIKKIASVVVILFLVIFFIAAGIDKLFGNKNNTTSTNNEKAVVTTPKNDENSKEVKNEPTEQENISKLEAIKSKVNSVEADRVDYIIKNIKTYPQSLISLLIRNPETVDYVYSFKDKERYNARKLSSNISSSYYVDGNVPLFLQWDRRWGYRDYGKEMLGLSGCGPTSLAMVIRSFDSGSGINPYDVAKYSQENGYISNENFTSWSLFEKGLAKYGLESKDVVPVEAKMKRALDNGQILIASVKPGIFTERGHIIVIKGYDKNGDFLINDPNSIVNTNKHWTFDELKNELRKIWGVSKVGGSSSDSNTTSSSSNNSSSTTSSSKNSSTSESEPSIIQDIN